MHHYVIMYITLTPPNTGPLIFSLLRHKNTRNILRHVILVTCETYEGVEGQGSKEILGDQRWCAVADSLPCVALSTSWQ